MSKRVQDGLWRGVLFLLILLPALQPLLQSDAMPCTHDSAFHYYRITTMKESLKQGWLFSRWVPGLALGFGYPFFNYREPLPYWAGEALLVAGIPAPLALGLLYALSMLAAAYGMFVLARDLFGEKAGWVSAVVYALSPYMLLDALRRGNMPEVWAFALMPWIFVAFRNLILGKGRNWFIIATALLSALFLSHNISSLLLAPFLGAYVVLLSILYKERKAWPWAFAAVGLTVLLTAWFWMPALLEQDYVQLHLSTSTRNNDFHYNFVTWAEILGAGSYAPYDPNYLNAPMRITLGVLQWVLALTGLIFGLWRIREKEQRWTLGLMALFGMGYLIFSTEGTVKLWEAFDLLAFVQFPWRLVGRALLPASLLAGVWLAGGSTSAKRKLPGLWLAVLFLAMVLVYPQTFPPKGMCAAEPSPDLADVHAYERQGWLGMDPESSYFPVWVEDHQIVTTRPELAEAMQRGENPARWDEDAMPKGAQVLGAEYHTLRAKLTVSTPEAFTARWWGLYFPGWQVKIDGNPVEVVPEEDTGLITFDVPEGEHEIKVRFGSTPLRRWAGIASVVGVILFAGALWWMGKRPTVKRLLDRINTSPSPYRLKPQASPTSGEGTALSVKSADQPDDDLDAPYDDARTSKVEMQWVLLGIIAVWTLVQALILPRVDSFLIGDRLTREALPEGVNYAPTMYDNGMQLLGYSIDSQQRWSTVRSGDEIQVDLLWEAMGIPQAEYRASVLLMDADGRQWSAAGTARPRGYEPTPPTTQWLPGQYGYDPHIISALPGTPPGDYRLVVSLFDRFTLTPATVLDASGAPVGPTLDIGKITLDRELSPPGLSQFDIPEGTELAICGPLGLRWFEIDRETAAPGDIFALDWIWEAHTNEAMPDILADVTLRMADNTTIKTWTLEPVADWYPTSSWGSGDRLRSKTVLRLPGSLESGTYNLEVTVPQCEDVLKSVDLDVTAPERVFALPGGIQPLAETIVFGEVIKLAGHNTVISDLQRGSSLLVQLAWQTEAEMETSYKVFLHLLAPDGSIAAQNDGEPAGWSRPTTGWAPGEVVVEERGITVPVSAPVGDYTLRVGVYDTTGRLVTAEGEDGYTLMVFEVR